MMLKRTSFACAVCFVLLWVGGCGSGEFQKVTGTVKFSDGSPLTQGQIIFSGDKVNPKGQVQEDGSFTLYTGENEGAPAGSYTVFFSGVDTGGGYVPPDQAVPTGPAGSGATGAAESGLLIDEKYLSVETSGIKRDVPAGGDHFDIVVEKPGAAAEGG